MKILGKRALEKVYVRKKCALGKACARKSVHSEKACARKSMRSEKHEFGNAHGIACAQKSVRSEKRALIHRQNSEIIDTNTVLLLRPFLVFYHHCGYSYAAFGFDRFIGF